MQLMSELSQMRLYSSRRKVYIPFNPDDKKRGATIKLLTRHIEDSINMMHTPYIYNPKYYDSFYIPRDVMAYINSDNAKEYDNDTKDDDDVLMEAIMNRADTFRFDYTCTEHDADIVKKIITAKKIKNLYELFHRGSYNWKPFTVYIFDNQRQLAKAINQEAILRNADYAAHSYCTERELFIVSPTGFKEISKAEVDYELYVMDELTTWVVMNCFPKCGRIIANHVGAGISGHARAIYNKKWDSYDIVDHGKAPNDRIEMAKCIDTVYRKYGIAPIIKLCKGDPDEFLKYSSIIAKDFVVDFGKGTVNKIKKLITHETYLNKLPDSLRQRVFIELKLDSKVDDNFTPKDPIKLSSLKKTRITKEIIDKYKSEYPDLRHVRYKDTKEYKCDGYLWTDSQDNLVAHVGSCEYNDDHTKWIVSLEILPKYKGHGLSKQILDFATKTMNCKYLSVNKSNKLAKHIYDEYGFKVFQEDDRMYFMSIDPNPKSYPVKESYLSQPPMVLLQELEVNTLDLSSTLEDDFTPGETIELSFLNKIRLSQSVIDKYKDKCPNLLDTEFKTTKTQKDDGYIWLDKEGEPVCYLRSREYTDDHTKWIEMVEVMKDFKGHGLAKQLLEFATKTMKCKYLCVDKNNEVARHVYDKYGFKPYYEDRRIFAMTLDSDPPPFYFRESSGILNENILKNTEDIYYNKDKFDSGEINLCFIAGHSGSGKSTLGREMQGGIVETYELDDLMCVKDHFTMDNLKEYGDLIYSYFNGVGKKYYVTCEELDNGKLKVDDYEFELVRDFVDYAMKYAKSHKDRKFVLEGIWILNDNYFSPYEFKDYAFYIKGTSMIISYARAVKRDARKPNGKFDLPKGAADFLFNRSAWRVYGAIERSIKRFVSYFREKTSAGIKENTILESDGTHADAVRIYQAMEERDRRWLDPLERFVDDDGKEVIYRHIERGEGIMDLKGFIEIKHDTSCIQSTGTTGSCIIGVHPRHRREGIGKLLTTRAIKECKEENKALSNLIWRVRADNKASQALAESCGFKLVRKNDVQHMYRYEYIINKDYKYLDDKILNENDLYQLMSKKFKYTGNGELTDRIRDIDDIAKTMKGTYADAARLASAYLNRMGIYNYIDCMYLDDKDGNIIYTRWIVCMSYAKIKFMTIDFTLLDSKNNKPGLKLEDEELINKRYTDQFMNKAINDCPDEVFDSMRNLHSFKFNCNDYKTGTRYNTFITTVHNEASTGTVNSSYNAKPYDFPIPIQPSVHNAGKQLLEDGYISKDNYIITENATIYFNEIDSNYDARIRRYIYKDRIKTSRELIGIYNTVKAKDKSIKRAYAKLDTYRGRNLFIDLSYYNDIFLNKLNLVKDKAVDLYFDFMQRLLKDSDEIRSRYNTSTIFIPVSNAAWNVGAGQSIIDYRQNINPISVIMRLLRRKPDLIKEALGGLNIIFLGKNGYFTADFSNFDMNKYGRLKNFFTRLAEADNIDDEDGYTSDTDTDSNAALALKMVDKIENNTGITLNNVSPIVSDTKKETMKDKIDRLGKELEDLNTIDYHHTDLEHMRIRSTEVPVLGKNDLNNVNSPYGTILGVLVDENIGSSVADNVISAVTITDLGRFNPPIVNN